MAKLQAGFKTYFLCDAGLDMEKWKTTGPENQFKNCVSLCANVVWFIIFFYETITNGLGEIDDFTTS